MSDDASVTFDVNAGVEYQIAVDSADYGDSPDPWQFQLLLILPPINDDFASRIALTGATAEPGDPAAGSLGEQTVWWRWTAPASGTATLNLSQMLYGGVFQGNALSNLVPVGSVGFISQHAFPVEAGVEYSIGVTTWSYYAAEFTLTLDAPEPPLPAKSRLHFQLSSARERPSIIETSTNLIDWEPFRTNGAGEPCLFITPRADEPQRFFRVR